MGALTRVSVTIPAGQTMSSAVDCSGFTILRIHISPVWASAPLTFQLSADGITFRDMYHAASGPGDFASYEVSVPNPVPGSAIVMPAATGSGIAFVRFRSGNHVTQIKQPADATFELVLEPVADASGGSDGAPGPVGPTGPAGPTGAAGATGAAAPPLPFQEIVLGVAKGVDYNVVGDTPVIINSSRYTVTRGIGVNNVGGGDIASVAVLTEPGGDDLGLGFYTQEGVLSNWPISGGIPVRTGSTVYIHVATAEGVPATGDIYLMGYDLTGV